MRHPRVAVALLFRYRHQLRLHRACCLFAFLLALSYWDAGRLLWAQDSVNAGGYLARIYNDSPEEVARALKRAELLYDEGKLFASSDPIIILLHGPEVEIFFKDNYEEYKTIVDLAARLSAFGVVDVRVCETQTGILGRSRSSVHSFIGTVPFGPTEVKRLLEQQNYVYF